MRARGVKFLYAGAVHTKFGRDRLSPRVRATKYPDAFCFADNRNIALRQNADPSSNAVSNNRRAFFAPELTSDLQPNPKVGMRTSMPGIITSLIVCS